MTRRRGGDAVVRRADGKLGHVAERWASALPVPCSVADEALLSRTLRFEGGEGLPFEEVTLRYEVRSKLFATLFDLTCSFRLPTPQRPDGFCQVAYDARRQGLIGQEGCCADSLLPLDPLLLDRIDALGVTSVKARREADGDCWEASVGFLVGSATWNLIPPVLHLIEPSSKECIQAMELLRMLACCLSCWPSESEAVVAAEI